MISYEQIDYDFNLSEMLYFSLFTQGALYATFSVAVLSLSFTSNQVGATICCACIGLLGGGTDGIYSALIAEVYSVQKYAYVYGYSNILTHSAGTAITIFIGKLCVMRYLNFFIYYKSILATGSINFVSILTVNPFLGSSDSF